MSPHREDGLARTHDEERGLLWATGWELDLKNGGWCAPEGYGFLTSFTQKTAWEIEVFLGPARRLHPVPRPGFSRRLRFWWYHWTLVRALDRERALARREARVSTFGWGMLVGALLTVLHFVLWMMVIGKAL